MPLAGWCGAVRAFARGAVDFLKPQCSRPMPMPMPMLALTLTLVLVQR